MKELNEKQLEAVKTTEGYLRVIAGAGSGKTRMLVARYIYIIKELGINPNNVVCLTFSNKTASEMKKRIRTYLSNDDLSFVTTYHGLGARIIREYAHLIFFPNTFQIIDRADQKEIMLEIYDELEIKLDKGTFESIIDKMETYKDSLTYIKYMVDTKTNEVEFAPSNIDMEIIRRYLTRQKKYFLVDFMDLINYAIYILEKFPQARNKWQEQLNYILVDEFQDSTSKEVRLVDLLCGGYENIMVVGDPDQNIYEWRGSEMRFLVDYDKTHTNTKTIVMNQNYRSNSKILTCANSLIKYNKIRYPKDLFTENVGGEDVLFFQGETDYKEAEWIVNKIKYLHDEMQESYNNIAILYRASYLSRVIEAKLTESTIPYEIIGNVKFFQRMEIKDIVSYMKLCCYDDDYAFKRIINVPRRQFGKIKMQKLTKLKKGDESLYNALKNNIDILGNSKIKEFVDLIETLRNCKLSSLEIFENLMTNSGYHNYIRELGDEERLDNLAELRRVIQGLLVDDESINLNEVLAYFSLQSDYEMEDADKVKLMTVHAAKGLEYNNVFVIGLNEGSFPSKKTIEERGIDGLEEERRLCYVALTRAKSRLFLTSPLGFNHEGGMKINSRFVQEIGQENYVSINVKEKKEEKKIEDVIKYKVLDKVTHKIFGEGVIVEIDYNFKAYRVLFNNSRLPRSVDFKYEFLEDLNEEVVNEIVEPDVIELEDKQNTQDPNYEEVNDNFNTTDSKVNIFPATTMFREYEEPIKINKKEEGYANLWNDPSVPKTGWNCIGITDLGTPIGFCGMCGQDGVRYLHHMQHDDYSKVLSVGCICAGKMESDDTGAKDRETNFKNKINRKTNFLKKELKMSRNGNVYVKYGGHNITIFKTPSNEYVVYLDNVKMQFNFKTKNEALCAIFDKIDE